MKRFLTSLSLLALTAVAANAQITEIFSGETPDTVYIDELMMDDVPASQFKKLPPLYRFRVYLTDKKNNPYSLKRPTEFLSQKSLDRRHRYGLKLDEHDLPVTPSYVEGLSSLGLRIHNMSKWNNTVVVETADSTLMARVRQLPYVKSTLLVWMNRDSVYVSGVKKDRHDRVTNECDTTFADPYGWGADQARQIHADKLHEAGYRGEGMTVAVLDGGFLNADIITGLKKVNVLGTRNFVDPSASVYDAGSHGTMVLSCIAANTPKFFVGTAPDAAFYLIQTEDGETEQLVEEDNYAAGVEYADSLGADIVTASLGYYHFDHKFMNHAYKDLDGNTAINSRSASLAASRGILLLNSAGNEGDNTWKKIGVPADAHDMIAVGAVRADSVNTGFSSLGYAADGRVKPDAMAMGEDCAVYALSGNVTSAAGTSFACPILCGGVTCLWQACRDKKPTEIIDAIHRAGNYHDAPNEVFGYGIPDLWKAYNLLKGK